MSLFNITQTEPYILLFKLKYAIVSTIELFPLHEFKIIIHKILVKTLA